MTFEIIIQIVFLGIALAMDAFAVSITDGLIYSDINKKKIFFIASTFAVMQALMPLIGYFIIELVDVIAISNSAQAGQIMASVVTWLAFVLLLIIGIKMLIEAIIELRKKEEETNPKLFSIKEVMMMGIATSIDALAAGVTLHAGLSNNTTVWIHVSIILIITFAFCLVGLFLGKQITKILKGKYSITGIIGGAILILLAVWVVVSHYTGI